MRLTSRYTLENWRTQEIDIYDIPDTVLSLSFEEILDLTFGRLRSLDLNPIELLFSCIFFHDDWRVVRTPMKRDSPVQQHMSVAIERATGVRDALYGSGVPDLFLWDSTGRYRFVEIKASEDSLNDNQQEWAEAYDWKFFIAQLAPVSEDMSDEELLNDNKIT